MSANLKPKITPRTPLSKNAPTSSAKKQGLATSVESEEQGSKFRVVSHAGNRYAFKLETVFWQILQLAADAKKKRMGAYIAEVLETETGKQNKTSILRSHAAEWVCRQLYEATSKMISPRALDKLVAASPVPALAMDSKNQIVGQNTPFLDLVRNLAGDRDISELGTIHVKFSRDVSAIRASARAIVGPYQNEKIYIKSKLGDWCFDARIVNIQSSQGNSIGLLLFITN